jgi:hypothetical protein
LKSFLSRLLLGDGTLPSDVREQLESEGVLFLAEGLRGSIRYEHFKAPGRRFNGKVTAERMGLGISAERIALYSRSGAANLIDSPFDAEGFGFVSVAVAGEGRLIFGVDYDKAAKPGVSGKIHIHVLTPEARSIAELLRARITR